jgi:Acetyltransferase (GNAT) domain/Acetyltransferase (GNAT) family
MSFSIRTLPPHEIALAVDWAAAEGWNPGLADATCFATVDPAGFLLGEIDGEPAATISVLNYDDRFAFLGFYIVRAALRGRGYGWRLWQAGMAHAGVRSVGLDGVVTQQENYKRSGFVLACRNVRYGGVIAAPPPCPSPDLVRDPVTDGMMELAEIPFAAIVADDAVVFPASRTAFLRTWIGAPGHIGRAMVRDGRLCAWGVIRPCRRGFKVGPLIADDRASAQAVFAALVAAVSGGEIFIDVPEPNAAAVALAREAGLSPVFETARMYKGAVRSIRLERIFGVTSFELG